MTRFPAAISEAIGAGHARAGGTDLTERRHLGRAPGDVVDLRDVPGLDAITRTADGGLEVGAKVTLAALAAHPDVRAGWPGLAAAAAGLATPQIRARATLGGNLLQEVRCWYYRNDEVTCLRAGGSACLARAGDHTFHSCFDLGPCAAPHASTMAVALLAFDAHVSLETAGLKAIPELLGDGSALGPRFPGDVLTRVHLPPPVPGERSAWFRAAHRARAEWPIAEAVARVRVDGGVFTEVTVAVGGVAPIPLLRPAVAAALVGRPPSAIREAAALAGADASPLPGTAWKVPFVGHAVAEALERAVEA